MSQVVAWLFGLGLVFNAALFIPQAAAIWRSKSAEGISLISFGGFNLVQLIGALHGYFQKDWSLFLGMAASLMTAGTVTILAARYRAARARGG